MRNKVSPQAAKHLNDAIELKKKVPSLKLSAIELAELAVRQSRSAPEGQSEGFSFVDIRPKEAGQ